MWRLIGESVVCFVRVPRGAALALPAGVRRVPLLPAVVVGVRYESSPVGRYCELSVAVVARVGLRVGLCVVNSVVSSVEARSVYRSEWGLPTELGTLVWSGGSGGGGSALAWEERGFVLRSSGGGGRWRVPVALPARSLQRLPDGRRVVVPRRLWGFLRLSRVDVSVSASAAESAVPLAWLAGSHRGAVFSGLRVVASPARVPGGLLSSLRVRAAEPGLAVD